VPKTTTVSETLRNVRLHLLLTLMICGVLVQTFVDASRLHLPTGATPKSAGAWLPESDGTPGAPRSRGEFAAVTEETALN
jgi:hypothetical protein